MEAMDDLELLHDYAARNSEPAFAKLVSRRVGFVYSAALRQVGNPGRRGGNHAGGVPHPGPKGGRLPAKTNLTGWLFKTTRFTALAHGRPSNAGSANRRPNAITTSTGRAGPAWEKMAPLLDEALAKLGEKDRQAVLLRYFENQSLAKSAINWAPARTPRANGSAALWKNCTAIFPNAA